MMKQLVLDIRPDAPPTLENFVAGTNAELVASYNEYAHRQNKLHADAIEAGEREPMAMS